MDRLTQLDFRRGSNGSRRLNARPALGADLGGHARTERQEGVLGAGGEAAVQAAGRFTDVIAELDRGARREHRTLPAQTERLALHAAFWEELIPVLTRVEPGFDELELARARREVQAVLNPWLLRSRLWARSAIKPFGYPGDYRMLEWMYDLERDKCADPCQPAAVNLLDGLYKSVHSVQAVWHRRAWFARLIAKRIRASGAPVRVLDVACGGSRYTHDVIERCGPGSVKGTFFDQDPAALAFVRSRLPETPKKVATFVCAPVKRFQESLPTAPASAQRRFDVVAFPLLYPRARLVFSCSDKKSLLQDFC